MSVAVWCLWHRRKKTGEEGWETEEEQRQAEEEAKEEAIEKILDPLTVRKMRRDKKDLPQFLRHVADRDAEAMQIWRDKGYVPLATGILAAIAAGDEEVLRVSHWGPVGHLSRTHLKPCGSRRAEKVLWRKALMSVQGEGVVVTRRAGP